MTVIDEGFCPNPDPQIKETRDQVKKKRDLYGTNIYFSNFGIDSN